ncbi:MAG: hypothetical protein E7597_01015 [Ruminococcaceae bacterium]|nr:hypothetical protein [Oscillospiraceae bacterium]
MKKVFALVLVMASLLTAGTFANAAEISLGDVNYDGKTDNLDAALILKHDALILPIYGNTLSLGDVNNDGKTDSLDAAQVLKHDAALIEIDCSIPEDGEGVKLSLEGRALSSCGSYIDIDDFWLTSLVDNKAMHKFENLEELAAFERKFDPHGQFGCDYDEVPSAREIFDSYDKEFFDEYTLFLIYTESSGSCRYEICDVIWYENSKKLEICYRYTKNPDMQTTDIVGWFLTVPVRKADIEGCKFYDVSFESSVLLYLPNEQKDGFVLKESSARYAEKGLVDVLENEGGLPKGSALADLWIEGTFLDAKRIAHVDMNSAFAEALAANEGERDLYLGCLANTLIRNRGSYSSVIVTADGQPMHEGELQLFEGIGEVQDYIIVYKNNAVIPPSQADMDAAATEIMLSFIRALYEGDAETFEPLMTDKFKDLAEISSLQNNYIAYNDVHLWAPEKYEDFWKYNSMADTVRISYYHTQKSVFPCEIDGRHLVLEYHQYFDDYGNDYDRYVFDIVYDGNGVGKVNYFGRDTAPQQDADPNEPDIEPPVDGEGIKLSLEGRAFTNCGYIDDIDIWQSEIIKFENLEELAAFDAKYNKSNRFDYTYGEVPSANSVFKNCDEAFFDEYTLFLIYTESSGSCRYEICDVIWYESSKKLEICYRYTKNPDIQTDDIEGWFLTVPVRKADIEGCLLYDLSFESSVLLYLPNEQKDGFVIKESSARYAEKGLVDVLENEGGLPGGSALADLWIEGTFLDAKRIAHVDMNSAFAEALAANEGERDLYLGCLANTLIRNRGSYSSVIVTAEGQPLHEGELQLFEGIGEVQDYIIVYKNNDVIPPSQADMDMASELMLSFIRALYEGDAETFEPLMTDKFKELAETSRQQDNCIVHNDVLLWAPEAYEDIWKWDRMSDTVRISYYDNADAEFPCETEDTHLLLEYHQYFDDYGNDYENYVFDITVDENGDCKINYFGLDNSDKLYIVVA